MSRKTRRAVLGAAGVTLLAGCSSSGDDSDDPQNNVGGGPADEEETPTPRPDSDGDGVPDAEDDLPNDPDFSVESEIISDERNIPEDEWYYWTYEFDGETELSYQFTVREGPAIDAILTSESEYQHLKDGERFRYATEGSVLDSAGGEATITPPEGTYYIVLDNSNLGEAVPPTNLDDDIASVEIEAYARR